MRLSTCLWFDGNAREAAQYYVDLFPESRLDENWITPTDTPGNEANSEVFVRFEIFGQQFIALNGGPQFPFSEAVSFEIPCRDQAEIDHYWDTMIADGGSPSMCGWLKDKFGLSWQVTSPKMADYLGGEDEEGRRRATQAMLAMTKIDLEFLRTAYSG